jgi:hypothetical protein
MQVVQSLQLDRNPLAVAGSALPNRFFLVFLSISRIDRIPQDGYHWLSPFRISEQLQ